MQCSTSHINTRGYYICASGHCLMQTLINCSPGYCGKMNLILWESSSTTTTSVGRGRDLSRREQVGSWQVLHPFLFYWSQYQVEVINGFKSSRQCVRSVPFLPQLVLNIIHFLSALPFQIQDEVVHLSTPAFLDTIMGRLS